MRIDYLNLPYSKLEGAFDKIELWIWGVAFVFTLLGYYTQVWRRRKDAPRMIEAIGVMAICVMFAASVSVWRPYLVNLMYWPAQTLARENDLFKVKTLVANTTSNLKAYMDSIRAASLLGGPTAVGVALLGMRSDPYSAYAALVQSITSILGFISSFIIVPFYVLQRVLVETMFTFLPIAITGLTLPPIKERCVSYCAMLLSVLAWPLGFSVIAAASNLVFEIPTLLPGATATDQAMQAYLSLPMKTLIASIIAVFGTLLVPPTLLYLFLYGGTQFDPISSAMRSVPQMGSFARR